jgi:hypothetical protein
VPVLCGYLLSSMMMEASSDGLLSQTSGLVHQFNGSPQPSHQIATEAPRSYTAPKAPMLDCSFNAARRTYEVLWHADAGFMQKKDKHLVSQPFGLNLWQHRESAGVFRLMIHPKGSSFKKSKGVCVVKLKCASDLELGSHDVKIKFSITVGNETRGPFLHDFSLHPIAELPKDQRDWNLKLGVQAAQSNTMSIFLQVHTPEGSTDEDVKGLPAAGHEAFPQEDNSTASAEDSNDLTLASCDSAGIVAASSASMQRTGGSVRSAAGRQRQRERHWRRQQHQSSKVDDPMPLVGSGLCLEFDKGAEEADVAMSEDQSTHLSDEESSEPAWSEIQDGDEDPLFDGPLDRLLASSNAKRHSFADGLPDKLHSASEGGSSNAETGQVSWAAIALRAPSGQAPPVRQPAKRGSSKPVSLREELNALSASLNSCRALKRPSHQRASWPSR